MHCQDLFNLKLQSIDLQSSNLDSKYIYASCVWKCVQYLNIRYLTLSLTHNKNTNSISKVSCIVKLKFIVGPHSLSCPWLINIFQGKMLKILWFDSQKQWNKYDICCSWKQKIMLSLTINYIKIHKMIIKKRWTRTLTESADGGGRYEARARSNLSRRAPSHWLMPADKDEQELNCVKESCFVKMMHQY